jgi:transcriptional regulator with XRE-family HTH domain
VATVANENLKNALEQAGLTVEQFAEVIEVDPKSVQRWVNAATIPYRKHRIRISSALNLSEQELWPGQASGTSTSDQAQQAPRATEGVVGEVAGTWAHSDQDGAPDLATFIAKTDGPIDVLDSSCRIPVTGEVTDMLIEQANAGRPVRILTDGRAPHWEPLLGNDSVELYLAQIPGEYWLIKAPDKMLVAINLAHDPADSPAPPILELAATGGDGLFHRLTQRFDELWQQADGVDASQPSQSSPADLTAGSTPPDPAPAADRRWPNQPA